MEYVRCDSRNQCDPVATQPPTLGKSATDLKDGWVYSQNRNDTFMGIDPPNGGRDSNSTDDRVTSDEHCDTETDACGMIRDLKLKSTGPNNNGVVGLSSRTINDMVFGSKIMSQSNNDRKKDKYGIQSALGGKMLKPVRDNLTVELFQHKGFFDEVFKGMKETDIVPGMTESLGLRVSDFRSLQYPMGFITDLITKFGTSIGQFYYDSSFCRAKLVSTAFNIMTKGDTDRVLLMSSLKLPQIVLSEREMANMKRNESFINMYNDYTSSEGSPGVIQYDKKLLYICDDETAVLYLIDSEGSVNTIHPISNPNLSPDTIYVFKNTFERDDSEPVTAYTAPVGKRVIIPELPGVLYSSMKELKVAYKTLSGSDYDSDVSGRRSATLRSLVGSLLSGSGVSDFSHGFVSTYIGFSLKRKESWLTTPSGVHKISNVTPETSGKMFDHELQKFNIDKQSLSISDIIVTRTSVGVGVNSPMNLVDSNITKRAISDTVGNLRTKLLDDDVIGFTTTGIAVFETIEAANKCWKIAKGDTLKYLEHLSEKTEMRTEKFRFIDGVKDAIFVGAGALIPQVFKFISKKLLVKKATGIGFNMMLSGLLPVLSGPVGTGFATMSATAALVSGFGFSLGGIPVIGPVITGIIGGISKGFSSVKDWVLGGDDKVNVFSRCWSKIVDLFSGFKTKGFAEGTKQFFTKLLEGIKSGGTKVFEFAKSFATRAVEVVVDIATSVGDFVSDIFSSVFNFA